MEKVLLVDYDSAARDAGKVALAELGCDVTPIVSPFDARFSANGHKASGKPFGVALINLHGYDTDGRVAPIGFAFATELAAEIGIPRIAVVGTERVKGPSFRATLERFGNMPYRSGDNIILLLYGENAPVRNGVTDWGAAYQLLMPAVLPIAA